jgi:hypothetical protein
MRAMHRIVRLLTPSALLRKIKPPAQGRGLRENSLVG